MLEVALEYYHKGWTVHPLPLRSKVLELHKWTERKWTEEQLREKFSENSCNIAVVLGSASNFLFDVDLDTPEARIAGKWFLPPTEAVFGRASAPDSHYLYYCPDRPEGTVAFTDANKQRVVELRGNRSYTILPPSIHESGEPITWTGSVLPDLADYNQLLLSCKYVAAAAMLAHEWKEGSRHELAGCLSGWLLRAGWTINNVRYFIRAVCATAHDNHVEDRLQFAESTAQRIRKGAHVTGGSGILEHYGEDTTRKIAKYLDLGDVEDVWQQIPPETDIANGYRLVKHFGHLIRRNTEERTWFVWQGSHWEEDIRNSIMNLAAQTAGKIESEAYNLSDEAKKRRLRWYSQSHQFPKIRNMISTATAYADHISIITDDLDQDPWLFNVQNGTIDLRTGKLRPHNPDDLITKISDIHYDPDAKAPNFEATLRKVFNDDEDLIWLFQRCVGYTMVGEMTEKVSLVCTGPTDTGKTTILTDALYHMFGDYAAIVSETVASSANDPSALAPEVYALRGARYALLSEPERKMKLSAAVKGMSGRNKITCRRPYRDMVTFTPSHTLWLDTNFDPNVDSSDQAVLNRLVIIPFEVQIPKEEQDKQLPLKLRSPEEQAGILAWAVKGCLGWQSDGLSVFTSDAVRQATEEYATRQDVIGAFLDECTEHKEGARIQSKYIHAAYQAWCQDNGYRPVAINRFGIDIKRRWGHKYATVQPGTTWCDVDLRNEWQIFKHR